MDMKLLRKQAADYMDYLKYEERSENTITQYQRDISSFLSWAESTGMELVKGTVIHYKEKLQEAYTPTSVNTKLAALNSFFSYLERFDLKVKQLKIQRQAYCSSEKELTKGEYHRLVNTAKKLENQRLALIIQTIGGTGIRVSELEFITGEAVYKGEAVVRLKGKTRTILIPEKLRRLLKQYMKQEKIQTGPVFITKNGRLLHRSSIWKMMKNLCKSAGVDEKKVFPHNLRHLFARCFYGIDKDIVKLADVLGHSSINTTRIYIISTGEEHRRQMDAMGLVVV